MPPKGMTANPVQPSRHRPGKVIAEQSSSEESGAESEEELEEQAPKVPAKKPAPKATSFPTDAKKLTSNLKNVDLNERRRQAELQEKVRRERERVERAKAEREAGFLTEDEDESGDEEGEDEADIAGDVQILSKPAVAPRRPPGGSSESSGEEDDSDSDSDSDASSSASSAPKLLRPVFIRKDQRNKPADDPAAAQAEAEAARRATEADALVQEKLERDAAARAAGKKNWDDDDPDIMEIVDDTDDLDPELERQQWVARELTRLKRARAALEDREAEIAEVERRKNLTPAEREAEDREHVSRQQEDKAGREKAGFMQRYHHRGAFYLSEGEDAGLADRDLMGAKYANAEGIRETMPEYLQVRDVTKIGRKGRTRYKDLKSEDTGRWADYGRQERGVGYERKRDEGRDVPFSTDERFRPDRPGGPGGATGANASSVGESGRKRGYDDGTDGGTKRARYAE